MIRAYKTIDNEMMDKMIKEAGFRQSELIGDKEWYGKAIFYKTVIWLLANEFTEGRCEMTHSEYVIRNGKIEIWLCLQLEENGHTYEDFGKYIMDNIGMIPTGLLEKFDLIIGFNYGEKGGIIFNGKGIRTITQEEFMNEDSDGTLHEAIIDPKTYMKMGKLQDLIGEFVGLPR